MILVSVELGAMGRAKTQEMTFAPLLDTPAAWF